MKRMKLVKLMELRSLTKTTAVASEALALLALVGCATGPIGRTPVVEDKAAQSKSQSYFADVHYVLASEKPSDGDRQNILCLVPAGAEKPLPLGVTTGPSKTWKELVAHAGACVRDKNWSKLEALGSIMARNDLDSPWGAYFLSLSAEGQGDHSRAIWMAELAQKKAGGRAALFFYQRGHILVSMGETARGMADLEHAAKLEPNFTEAQHYLAQIYQRDQQPEKAAQYQERTTASVPNKDRSQK